MVSAREKLRIAADALIAARRECAAAESAANAAYRRLEASPENLEYQIAFSEARKREAAAALRRRQAEAAYLAAGGYVREDSAGE